MNISSLNINSIKSPNCVQNNMSNPISFCKGKEIIVEHIDIGSQETTQPQNQTPKMAKEEVSAKLSEIEAKIVSTYNGIRQHTKEAERIITEKGIDSDEYKQCRKEEKELRRQYTQLKKDQKYYTTQLQFCIQYEKNPNTAFLYNPDIKPSEYNIIGYNSPVRKVSNMFGDDYHLPTETRELFIKRGLLDVEQVSGEKYIDISTPKNAELIAQILDKKDSLVQVFQFGRKYNLPLTAIKRMVYEGKISIIGGDKQSISEYDLVDTSDETTQETIARHVKLTPQASKKYSSSSFYQNNEVPAAYLAKIGLGKFQDIVRLYQARKLSGKTIDVQTPDGVKKKLYINVTSEAAKMNLQELRNRNKDIISKQDLMKELKMSASQLEEAILDGKLDIIPEYLFFEDSKRVFFDLSSQKINNFMNKQA